MAKGATHLAFAHMSNGSSVTAADRTRLARCVGMLMLACCGAAFAQSYPSKAVRMIVPFPPGGGTDYTARLIGQKLSETWKQPVVIENRPGASTIIGSDLVAKSA